MTCGFAAGECNRGDLRGAEARFRLEVIPSHFYSRARRSAASNALPPLDAHLEFLRDRRRHLLVFGIGWTGQRG